MLMKPIVGVYGFWANEEGEIRVAKDRTVWRAWPAAALQDHDNSLWLVEPFKGVQLRADVLIWETFVGPVPFGQSVAQHDKNYKNLALENLFLEHGVE